MLFPMCLLLALPLLPGPRAWVPAPLQLAAHLRGLTAYLGWILGANPPSATFLAE